MKKIIPYITASLILVPLLILLYKSQVLKISLVPQMVDDVWEFHLSVRPKGVVKSFSFPVPKSGQGVRVTDEKFKKQGYTVFSDTNNDSIVMTWASKEPIIRRVQYTARVDIKPVKYKVTKDTTESYPNGLQEYLEVPKLLPEDEDAIKLLEGAILEERETKTSAIRKIYYYMEEEIQRNTDIKTIHETLITGKGSPLIKAKLF
ncbi:MAG: UUP1 family membrane protein, partial [Bacteriovoracaceae bacterium]